MSVFLENRRHDSDYELQSDRAAPRASSVAGFFASARKAPHAASPASRSSLWGLSYDRIEGVVHLVLAFTVVGGAAAIMSTSLFSSGAPVSGATEKHAEVAAPKVATAVVASKVSTVVVAPANEEPEANPPVANEMAAVAAPPAAPVAAPPAPPAATPPAPPAAQKAASAPAEAPSISPFLNGRPMTEAAAVPEPLAPPPADMREKLTAGRAETPPSEREITPQATAPEPEPKQAAALPEKSVEAPKAAEDARTAKCYLKLGGRVQNSGTCTVHHSTEAVTFDLPGKPLEIAHKHGRVWMATLGGRSLGQVYKNKGAACWGARGFYACEKG